MRIKSNLWVQETFGPVGGILREELLKLILECHNNLVNAQDVSKQKHEGIYGNMYRRVMEGIVEKWGDLPEAEIIKYREYKFLAINGAILFPWRYGKDATRKIESCDFNPGDSRLRHLLFGKEDESQLCLDLDAGVSNQLQDVAGKYDVVIVGYASSPSALYNIEWGKVTSVSENGFLDFSFRERLFDNNVSGIGSMDIIAVNDEAFDVGPIPYPQLEMQEDLSEEDNG